MQYDPKLKELVLRATRPAESRTDASLDTEVPVVARLASAGLGVEGLREISRFGAIVTGRARLGDVERIRMHPGVRSLKAGRMVRPALSTSRREVLRGARETDALGASGGRGVVIGLIDWGCDFAHSAFLDRDGRTRLLALWDQRGGPSADSPAAFGYGRLFDRAAIDRALGAEDPYRALGYDPEDADADGDGTHGTHVLDIAAGSGGWGGSAGIAPEVELVFVHLLGRDTSRRDTMGDSVHLLEALRFVLDQAGDSPVVVNLSVGQHGGPHDGTTLVERALDAAVRERPGRAIVMSTGNYHLSRVHAEGRVRQGHARSLVWDARARQDSFAEMEIWYHRADRFSAELVTPDGRVAARVGVGEDAVFEENGRVVATLYHRERDPNNGDRQIDVFLWPQSEHGCWTVRLAGEEVRDGRFSAWIEREDAETQTRFVRDQAVRHGTTNTICNGRFTIAVGAYDGRSPGGPAMPFSSVGPTRDGRSKPDIAAPGARVRAARSSRRTERGRTFDRAIEKSGTSMAAPCVTGTVALVFEAALPRLLTIEETRAVVLGTARPVEVADRVGRMRFGAGRVDAAAAVAAVRRVLSGESAARRRARRPRGRSERANPGWIGKEEEMDSEVLEFLEGCPDVCIERAGGSVAVQNWLFGEAEQACAPESSEASWDEATPERTRGSIGGLSSASATRLRDRLTEMAGNGQWAHFVDVHGTTGQHRNLLFLPWHRWFIYEFENLLGMSLPYWNWVNGAALPQWVRDFRPNIRRADGTRITWPRLRDDTRFGQPITVTRKFTPLAPLPGTSDVSPLLSESSFTSFSTSLEDHHGTVHVHIGGVDRDSTDGPMTFPPVSPADFLFWLHHCEVDRIWWLWQRRSGHSLPSTLGRTSSTAIMPGTDSPPPWGTSWDDVQPSGWTAADVANRDNMRIQYRRTSL